MKPSRYREECDDRAAPPSPDETDFPASANNRRIRNELAESPMDFQSYRQLSVLNLAMLGRPGRYRLKFGF
jgi:hypothetical protein